MGRPAKVGDIVEVVWDDAWCDQSETSASDWRDETRVTTYGRLVRRTPRVISVAAEIMPDEQYRAVTHIPVRMIVGRIRQIGSPR